MTARGGGHLLDVLVDRGGRPACPCGSRNRAAEAESGDHERYQKTCLHNPMDYGSGACRDHLTAAVSALQRA